MSERKRTPMDARFEIRCSSADKTAWQALAKSRGVSLAKIFAMGIESVQGRVAKFDALKRQVELPDHGLKIALSRIGNNLNQLVKNVNTSLYMDEYLRWFEVALGIFAIRKQLQNLTNIALSISKNEGAPNLENSIAVLDWLERNPTEYIALMEKINNGNS